MRWSIKSDSVRIQENLSKGLYIGKPPTTLLLFIIIPFSRMIDSRGVDSQCHYYLSDFWVSFYLTKENFIDFTNASFGKLILREERLYKRYRSSYLIIYKSWIDHIRSQFWDFWSQIVFWFQRIIILMVCNYFCIYWL